MNDDGLWERCAAFHGHVCGGLAIGYKAALYAARSLGFSFSSDEELVCIAENDACGIDAIQIALGCTLGKGNLLFHITGKQAFSFYDRASGASVRLCLKERPAGMGRDESLRYFLESEPEELFKASPTSLPLPEKARIFAGRACDGCGEIVAESLLVICGDEAFCRDCRRPYDRFGV